MVTTKNRVSHLQKYMLFLLGYGFDSDGAIQWSGLENLDKAPSNHGDYTFAQVEARLKEARSPNE